MTTTCCIVLPLAPLSVGDAFDRSDWAPHITVIGDLELPAGTTDTAAAVLRRFAAEQSPIEAVVGAETHLADGRVLVDLVDAPVGVVLHDTLLTALQRAIEGLELVTPAYAREGFRPHRTVVSGPRPARGDVLRATGIALVELDPPGLPGSGGVLARWDLGATPAPVVMGADEAGALLAILDQAQVRSWVIGGLGVDALVGVETRGHHDLDLLIAGDETRDALGALARTGYVVRSVWSENRWTGEPPRLTPSAFVAVDPAGHEVDVHTVDVVGDAVRPRSVSDVTLPARALTASGVIGDRRVPCATAEAQLVMHSGYALPQRQEADVAVLKRLAAS